MTKRFVTIDYDELYYTIDTKGLKTLNDFIKETNNIWNEDESLTEDKVKEIALEDYGQYLYENSMSSTELENKLNKQDDVIQVFKKVCNTCLSEEDKNFLAECLSDIGVTENDTF